MPWPFWILQRPKTCACAWWLPFLSEISRRRQLHPPPVSWDFVLTAIFLCPCTLRDFFITPVLLLAAQFYYVPENDRASKKREKVGAWANFSFRPKNSPARKKVLLPKMGYMCVRQFSQHRRRFY
jgi:hypothetical protein